MFRSRERQLRLRRPLRDAAQLRADAKFLRGVGKLLRKWRKKRGMHQEELALAAMLSPRQYRNIESRPRSPDMKLTTFVLLLAALDVSFSEFFSQP